MSSPIVPSDSYKEFLTPLIEKPASKYIKELLPNFRITHLIGSGGFAKVYKGTDHETRKVGVKVPQTKIDETLDAAIYEKFIKEAEIWRKLDHENIVKLFDSGNQPFPYLITELMEGGSLKQLMNDHVLSINEAVYIMIQVLRGLSFAHRMATVHRDLKPENILFTSDGVPKITDWGIGKLMGDATKTKSLNIKGTLDYCTPEQFDKKKFGKVDWQTDIFQLGTLFYEMLTGVNPFGGEDMAECVGKVLMFNPDPPSSFNPDIEKRLDDLIVGAIVKEKRGRWRTDVMLYKLEQMAGETKKNAIGTIPSNASSSSEPPISAKNQKKSKSKQKRKGDKNIRKILIFAGIILILILGFLSYYLFGGFSSESKKTDEVTELSLNIDDGNNIDATRGCFFLIHAEEGVNIDPNEYSFFVAEYGYSPKKLDMNIRAYMDAAPYGPDPSSGDLNRTYDWTLDGELWSEREYIGFDMPKDNMGIRIRDGVIYEVNLKNPKGTVVYRDTFIYRI